MIFINGRALSRYWEVGPQRSAYLPAPFLKKGKNEFIVLELEAENTTKIGRLFCLPIFYSKTPHSVCGATYAEASGADKKQNTTYGAHSSGVI